MSVFDEFRVPVHLRDLELAGTWVGREAAARGVPKSKFQRAALDGVEAEIERLGVAEALASGGAAFEVLYCFVRDASAVSENVRTRVVDCLCSALMSAASTPAVCAGGSADDDARTQRNAFVMTAYLCQAAFLANAGLEDTKSTSTVNPSTVEEDSSSEDYSEDSDDDDVEPRKKQRRPLEAPWSKAREGLLRKFAKSLDGVDVASLWSFGTIGDEFLLLWTRLGARLALSSSKQRSPAAMDCMLAALRAAPENVGFGAAHAAAVVEELISSEESAAAVADLCAAAPEAIVGDVLREVRRIDEASPTAAKATAKFLDHLATKAPKACAAQLGPLRELLATATGQYAVRAAVTTALAAVVCADADSRRRLTKKDKTTLQQEETSLLGDEARDDALALLFSRRLDVNHYARSAALRSILSVVERGALPLALFAAVVDAVAGRLRDKAALVRRAALKVLAALVEHNPYRADLSPTSFKQTIDAWDKMDQQCAPPQNNNDAPPSSSDAADPSSDATAPLPEKAEPIEVRFSRDAVKFVERLEEASLTLVSKLLESDTAGDATGAAEFFVVAKAFSLPCADEGLRRSLRLMSSPDDAVRRRVAALVAKAISEPDAGPIAADKFRQLVDGCSATDIACLEDLVLACSTPEATATTKKKVTTTTTARKKKKENDDDDGDFQDDDDDKALTPLASPKFVRALWFRATTDADKAAVRALAVLASARGAEVVDAAGLRALAVAVKSKENFALAAALATLLRDASSSRNKTSSSDFRKAAGSAARAIRDALSLTAVAPNDVDWYVAADAVIVATFAVDNAPETAASRFLSNLGHGASSKVSSKDDQGPYLARLLHAAGHVALQLTAAADDLGKALKKQNDKGSSSSSTTTSKKDTAPAAEQDELEAGLGGGAEGRDYENERRLATIVERDILGGDVSTNQLAVLAPLAAKVCERGLALSKEAPRSSELLRAATLALAKFACVSRDFCEAHLPLLVTTLVSAADVGACVNVAVALGDLAARQPNSVEPWTDHVYAALNDPDLRVRGNVLAALARLALNDLVKLKGAGVADLAKRVVDDDPAIRFAAKAFFTDLHRKSTAKHSPIYNLLPDVVSRLAHGEATLFENVIAFLLGFVDKDKHIELLAEKLVHRIADCLKTSDDPNAARNLSFALSKLAATEKLVRKLSDLFPLYKQALHDDVAATSFAKILAKAKANHIAKPIAGDFDDLLRDWATKLHSAGVAGGEKSNNNNNDTASLRGGAGVLASPAPATARKKKPATSRAAKKTAAKPTTTKKKQSQRRRRNKDDDDDDDDVSAIDDDDNSSALFFGKENRESLLS